MKQEKYCRTCKWFLCPEVSLLHDFETISKHCPYSYHRIGPGKYDGYTVGGRKACDHYQEAEQGTIVFKFEI